MNLTFGNGSFMNLTSDSGSFMNLTSLEVVPL